MLEIEKLTEAIRNFSIDLEVKRELQIDPNIWYQFCSSLDVIEDTQLAIDFFQEATSPNEEGEKYLRIYGLLQAMYLQQDATANLGGSFGLKVVPRKYPDLGFVRDVRNEAVGHPTKKETQKNVSYHFIHRIRVSREGFTLGTESKLLSGTKSILFSDLITKQNSGIVTLLNHVLANARARFPEAVSEI